MAQRAGANICQRSVGENSLPGHGPVILMKRPVRNRMQGVVGAGGLKPPATRFCYIICISCKRTLDLSLLLTPILWYQKQPGHD